MIKRFLTGSVVLAATAFAFNRAGHLAVQVLGWDPDVPEIGYFFLGTVVAAMGALVVTLAYGIGVSICGENE